MCIILFLFNFFLIIRCVFISAYNNLKKGSIKKTAGNHCIRKLLNVVKLDHQMNPTVTSGLSVTLTQRQVCQIHGDIYLQ